MHLSMSCPTPQGKVGQYRQSSVKFPSAGTKKLVKTPLYPNLEGFYSRFVLPIKIFFGSANCHCQKPPEMGQDVIYEELRSYYYSRL